MTMNRKINVLYIDDEHHNLTSFKAIFRFKYEVFTAISASVARQILVSHPNIEIIITDQRMPEQTGVEFLESILDVYPLSMRILLTGYADLNAVVDAVNKGKIFHYLGKPWNEEELDETIQRAYEEYKRKIQIIEANKNLTITAEQLEFLLRQKLLS